MMYDFFIRNRIDDEAITNAIAGILHKTVESVRVVSSISDVDANDDAEVFIEKQAIGGDFLTFISIYMQSDQELLDEFDFARAVSLHFACDTLFGAESDNPYEWDLVSQAGDCRRVVLADIPLDERGEAVLCD